MYATKYTFGQNSAVGYFIAGKKTTRENGATSFIPGSHLWNPATPPDESLVQYAELEPGDSFMMLASCFHAGSANTTKDEESLVYSGFMTKGYLRREENQHVANDWKIIKDIYSVETLKMLGYGISDPFLGWVDFNPRL